MAEREKEPCRRFTYILQITLLARSKATYRVMTSASTCAHALRATAASSASLEPLLLMMWLAVDVKGWQSFGNRLSSRLKIRSMLLSTSNVHGRSAAARQQRCQQVRTTLSRWRAPRWLPALAIDAPSAQIPNGLIGLLEDQRLQHSPCALTVFMLQPARTRSLAKAL